MEASSATGVRVSYAGRRHTLCKRINRSCSRRVNRPSEWQSAGQWAQAACGLRLLDGGTRPEQGPGRGGGERDQDHGAAEERRRAADRVGPAGRGGRGGRGEQPERAGEALPGGGPQRGDGLRHRGRRADERQRLAGRLDDPHAGDHPGVAEHRVEQHRAQQHRDAAQEHRRPTDPVRQLARGRRDEHEGQREERVAQPDEQLAGTDVGHEPGPDRVVRPDRDHHRDGEQDRADDRAGAEQVDPQRRRPPGDRRRGGAFPQPDQHRQHTEAGEQRGEPEDGVRRQQLEQRRGDQRAEGDPGELGGAEPAQPLAGAGRVLPDQHGPDRRQERARAHPAHGAGGDQLPRRVGQRGPEQRAGQQRDAERGERAGPAAVRLRREHQLGEHRGAEAGGGDQPDAGGADAQLVLQRRQQREDHHASTGDQDHAGVRGPPGPGRCCCPHGQ